MTDRAFPMLIHMNGKLQGDLGMTLRDYFAAHAMQGLLASPWVKECPSVSQAAYEMADTMMERRK